MRFSFLIILFFFLSFSYANRSVVLESGAISIADGGKTFVKKKHKQKKSIRIDKKTFRFLKIQSPLIFKHNKKRTKGGAILMAILTGPIGGHRLYLGSSTYVPIFYALTLGGGLGILPLIDIIAIATTKDLSLYENNGSILMWGDKLLGY